MRKESLREKIYNNKNIIVPLKVNKDFEEYFLRKFCPVEALSK